MARRLDTAEYKRRIKIMREYLDMVELQIDLRKELTYTPQQLRKINKYYKVLEKELVQGATKKYKSRSSENLGYAAEAIGSALPKAFLKAVPVPVKSPGAKIKVTKRKTKSGKKKMRLVVQNKVEKGEFVPLSKTRLLENPAAEIARALKGKKFATGFFPIFGNYYMHDVFYDTESAIKLFFSYLSKYTIDTIEKGGLRGLELLYARGAGIKQRSVDDILDQRMQQLKEQREMRAEYEAREKANKKRKRKSKYEKVRGR